MSKVTYQKPRVLAQGAICMFDNRDGYNHKTIGDSLWIDLSIK
jgi:hypothetical protein